MKRLVSGVILLAWLAIASAAMSAERPNIVLIYADDMGWKDTGWNGDGFIETPHLDALRKESMEFTNAYACAGNCQPSRACLLSGNYTPRHHVYAVGSTSRGPKKEMRLVPIPNRDGLEKSDLTIADALHAAGYATGHFGKWHLYNRRSKGGALASDQGFDESYDSFGEGELEPGSEGNRKGPPEDPKGVFVLTDKAAAFMKTSHEAGKPFFVYLAHHAVHTPLQAREKTREKFTRKGEELGKSRAEIEFAAMVHELDASVGRLLKEIDGLGLREKTVVVFTSDNGGIHQLHSQEPLRGNKGCYYEGGIREPMLARWPGVIAAGSSCETPVIQVDLFPTFVALAEGKADKTLDGESLIPLLKNEGPLKREAIFWHFPGYLDRPVNRSRDDVFRTRPVTVIRKGDWKLHLCHEEWLLDGGRKKLASNNAVELYNLRDDIGEREDLSNKETSKRDELLDDLLAWMEKSGAKFATVKGEKP